MQMICVMRIQITAMHCSILKKLRKTWVIQNFARAGLELIWFGRRGGLTNANGGELPSRSNGPLWDHYFPSAAR